MGVRERVSWKRGGIRIWGLVSDFIQTVVIEQYFHKWKSDFNAQIYAICILNLPNFPKFPLHHLDWYQYSENQPQIYKISLKSWHFPRSGDQKRWTGIKLPSVASAHQAVYHKRRLGRFSGYALSSWCLVFHADISQHCRTPPSDRRWSSARRLFYKSSPPASKYQRIHSRIRDKPVVGGGWSTHSAPFQRRVFPLIPQPIDSRQFQVQKSNRRGRIYNKPLMN